MLIPHITCAAAGVPAHEELINALYSESVDTAHVLDLIARGANVNERDNRLFTPLHYAVSKGIRPIVSALLDKGADVNARVTSSWDQRTPLHFVNNIDILHELFERGADVHAKNADGQTARFLPNWIADFRQAVHHCRVAGQGRGPTRARRRWQDCARLRPAVQRCRSSAPSQCIRMKLPSVLNTLLLSLALPEPVRGSLVLTRPGGSNCAITDKYCVSLGRTTQSALGSCYRNTRNHAQLLRWAPVQITTSLSERLNDEDEVDSLRGHRHDSILLEGLYAPRTHVCWLSQALLRDSTAWKQFLPCCRLVTVPVVLKVASVRVVATVVIIKALKLYDAAHRHCTPLQAPLTHCMV